MSKPVLYDLGAAAGGATVGYQRAGFDVIGFDIDPQPAYPAELRLERMLEVDLEGADAVHASAPCQGYSNITRLTGNPDDWPRYIEPLRAKFQAAGIPYVLENVVGAPLIDPVVLCGTMFPQGFNLSTKNKGLRVIRHRLFETSFKLPQPEHPPHPLCYTRDKRKPHYGKLDEMVDFVQVTGGGNCSVAAAKDAMQMDWPRLTKHDLNEAIPPAYAEYVGENLYRHLIGAISHAPRN